MDWIVTTYDEFDRIIDSWVIENRTESEAFSEAMADVKTAADWSIILKDF